MTAVTTLVIWISCAVIGWIGFSIPYPGVPIVPAPAKATQVEIISVELTTQSAPLLETVAVTTPPSELARPDEITPLLRPSAPPLIAVAEPAVVEFALPVRRPVQIVEPGKASVSRPAEPVAPVIAPAQAIAAPQRLQFGYGEGKQPRPDYPLNAQRAGQEGVVTVRFTVGENGRVLSAEAANASRWALLNDAAVRAVRERWHFSPGPVRLYEVAIRFEIKNKKV